MHKKREGNDPNRFFLSELILFTGWVEEEELGSNDEKNAANSTTEKGY